LADDANPFLRYRHRLDSYRSAIATGWTDDQFVGLVRRLDAEIAEVEGHGFVVTPFGEEPALASALDLSGRLWIKDDTNNVSGSHKARHLFGVMLHLALAHEGPGELAIASCGNAALAAAVVAKAEERPLRVFIPTWADPAVVRRLEALDARIEVAARREGEVGDPTYLRMLEAVEQGAVPFSVQGTVTRTTLDGGRTMGWELADQLEGAGVGGTVRVLIQIGGGALASATWMGLTEGIADSGQSIRPVLHPVQSEACAPLARAYEGFSAVVAERGLDAARQAAESTPEDFMWPWERVGESAATGILDDVAYDWLTVVEPTVSSGGWPVVVPESAIVHAQRLAREHTAIDVDATGTAGLAALVGDELRGRIGDDAVVALFTGHMRA
jgi:threonine synthase